VVYQWIDDYRTHRNHNLVFDIMALNKDAADKLKELFERQKARIKELEADNFELRQELGARQFQIDTLTRKLKEAVEEVARIRINWAAAQEGLPPLIHERSKKGVK